MNDWPDMRLLREYAEHGSEEAFTRLVARHLAMVYDAALRQTRQHQLAEEIVQTVFTLLARKADRISANTMLSGWLFETARFVSLRLIRDENRWQQRQAEAARMNSNPPSSEPSGEAEQVLPLLDEMLARLPDQRPGRLCSRAISKGSPLCRWPRWPARLRRVPKSAFSEAWRNCAGCSEPEELSSVLQDSPPGDHPGASRARRSVRCCSEQRCAQGRGQHPRAFQSYALNALAHYEMEPN